MKSCVLTLPFLVSWYQSIQMSQREESGERANPGGAKRGNWSLLGVGGTDLSVQNMTGTQ